MDHPLVSVVMPSYNQVDYLELAIRSVLEQDYPYVEFILMDGGSTDGSVEVIKRYDQQLAFWESKPDKGQASAINEGLRKANGQYVAWLNSDDAYLPGTIKSAVEAFGNNPGVGMVYGDGLMVDSNEILLDRHTYSQVDSLELLCFSVILQPATFMRRSALEEIGYLNSDYNLILDHELWVRITSKYPVLYVPAFWAIERTHPEAKTIAQAGGFVEEATRLIEWARTEPSLRSLFDSHERKIMAGLDVFAARRLIDAGEYRVAFKRIMQGSKKHPATVLRYWYKVVQAGGSALGFAGAFEWYRRTRRKVTHRGLRVRVLPDLETDGNKI